MGPVNVPSPDAASKYLRQLNSQIAAGWDKTNEIIDEQKEKDANSPDYDGGTSEGGSKLSAPVQDTPLSLYLSSKLKSGK